MHGFMVDTNASSTALSFMQWESFVNDSLKPAIFIRAVIYRRNGKV